MSAVPVRHQMALSEPTAGPAATVLRRLMAAAAIALLAPLWLLTAAVVWTCLGRPLLFRQTRSGLNARPFTLWKFRTMHDWRNADGKPLPDAERQTPVTRFLRRLRLDELPQLVAIAKGEMAFIGPRPLLPGTIEGFGHPGLLRCTVLPGLTGWAQVNGNTQLTDVEKLALDLWYVANRSFALDCRILALTLLVVLRGERLQPENLAKAFAATPALQLLAAGERS